MRTRPTGGAELPDTSTWLTRFEVVEFSGIGLSTIPALERRGALNPRRAYRRDTRGAERLTVVYDPDEVARLPRRGRASIDRSPGEVTARAFELFREARTDEEVVIELRETVERIIELREKWLCATSAEWVISPVAREAIEKLVGPFNGVADLIDRIVLTLKHQPPDSGRA